MNNMSRQLINQFSILLLLLYFITCPIISIKRTNLLLPKQNTSHINYTLDDNDDVIINETDCNNLTDIIKKFIEKYPIDLWKENGFFQEDYLKKINKHWLIFSPPNKRNHYILAGIYVCIMLIGLFGNLVVIILFIRSKNIRTPANIFIMNLAVSDFLMMSKMPIFIYNSIYQGPALGDYVCRYFGFVGGLSGTVSICTLAAISLDRYYVVKFPLNRKMTSTRAKIYLAGVWIYGTIFSIIPLLNFGLGKYVPEGYLTSCSFDYLTNSTNVRLFIFAFFIAAWFIPFIIITFSYSNILYVVILTRNVLKEKKDSSKHVKEEETRKQEIHLALIVLLIICLWFIAWTPYATVALLGISGNEDYISPLGSMIPALFCKSASCIDPFVYALTHPRFKKELKSFFCNKPLERSYTARTSQTSQYKRSTRKSRLGSQSVEEINDGLEEISLVSFKCDLNKQISSKPNCTNTNIIQSKDNVQFKGNVYWWYRPNFNNRSSSIKSIKTIVTK